MLEATQHRASCFLTLTYRDPECGPPRGNILNSDVESFLKRLRARVHPVPVRYFAIGDYGAQTLRPHYHLAVFGVGPEESALFEDCWGKGFVMALPLCRESAQYVVGYVSQKLSERCPPGRVKPKALMSRHPGLGAPAIDGGVVPALSSPGGRLLLQRDGDVPRALRHGDAGLLPLGRYLVDRARAGVGLSSGTPHEKLEAFKEEMRSLRRGAKKVDWVTALRSVDDQAYMNLEARERIRRQRRSL